MTESEIYRSFGELVAVRRRNISLTQAELAGRVGISRASIANIERGRQSVLLHQVYRLAEALELSSVSDLMLVASRNAERVEFDVVAEIGGVSLKQRAQIEQVINGAISSIKSSKV